jgi:hypothetical protein
LRLGAGECSTWIPGSRVISNGQYSDISFSYLTGAADLNIAIGWDEHPEVHNNLDLYLYDSAGALRGRATSPSSVFEVIHVAEPKTPYGTWRARIAGTTVTGSQSVWFLVDHTNGRC